MADEGNDAEGEDGQGEKGEEEDGGDVTDGAAAMVERDRSEVVIIIGDDAGARNKNGDGGGGRGRCRRENKGGEDGQLRFVNNDH